MLRLAQERGTAFVMVTARCGRMPRLVAGKLSEEKGAVARPVERLRAS
jgi:hypothetical protein